MYVFTHSEKIPGKIMGVSKNWCLEDIWSEKGA